MSQIKNLKKAAARIKKAAKRGEKIVILADADLDGTTSLIILEETIKSIGGSVSLVYFPDREKEGYGLQKKALNFLKKYAPALLILLDFGITNFEEVLLAKKLGFEVIIIDHHEVLEKVPEAEIVVDPKQKGDKSSFKMLATCGICFKVSGEIFGGKIPQIMERNFLELTALGTLADKMPQTHDNEIFIQKGLSCLPFTFRPGIRLFFKIFPQEDYSFQEVVQRIISILQITKIVNHITESYLLLSEFDEVKAEKLLKTLIEESKERQILIKKISESIEGKISHKDTEYFIFEGGEDIPLILSGAVAGRLSNKFQKPVFIYSLSNNLARGSIRSLQGIDIVEVLRHCSRFLEVYGGHPAASGFTLKKNNLEKFKECLKNYFEERFAQSQKSQ